MKRFNEDDWEPVSTKKRLYPNTLYSIRKQIKPLDPDSENICLSSHGEDLTDDSSYPNHPVELEPIQLKDIDTDKIINHDVNHFLTASIIDIYVFCQRKAKHILATEEKPDSIPVRHIQFENTEDLELNNNSLRTIYDLCIRFLISYSTNNLLNYIRSDDLMIHIMALNYIKELVELTDNATYDEDFIVSDLMTWKEFYSRSQLVRKMADITFARNFILYFIKWKTNTTFAMLYEIINREMRVSEFVFDAISSYLRTCIHENTMYDRKDKSQLECSKTEVRNRCITTCYFEDYSMYEPCDYGKRVLNGHYGIQSSKWKAWNNLHKIIHKKDIDYICNYSEELRRVANCECFYCKC